MKNKEELKNQILIHYNKGLKDTEIARLLNVSESFVGNYRRSKKLPTNGRTVVSDEKFLELFNQGLSATEISKTTGMSPAACTRRFKKLNINYAESPNAKRNDTKINKEQFLKEYNNGHNDVQLAKIFNCSESKILTTRKKYNLPIQSRLEISKDEFMDLYSEGYTDKQMSDHFNKSEGYVRQVRLRLNLPYNKKQKTYVPLTDIEYQTFLGTVLGDSYLGKRYNDGDCFLTCNHCVEQKDFMFYKYELLKNLANPPRLIDKYDERFEVPEYQQWYLYVRTNPSFNELYYQFYQNKVKVVPKELLKTIEPLGLAIWYMDDGSNLKYSYLLCTQGFSRDDVNIIQEVFQEKFDLKVNIHSDNGIYIPAESKEKFKNLIKPHMIESMMYKLE